MLSGLLPACQNEKEAPMPNFVVVLTDDLGWGDLSCYGHPIIQTPAIDKLASQGMRLTDCHSGGTVCSPSRAALLTGRNPYRSGFHYIADGRNSFLREHELTLAELLREKGYQTAFFGKWHLSKLENTDHPNPGDQGFDEWMATSVNAFEGPENPIHFIRNGEPMGVVDGWYCDIIFEEGKKWLETIDPTRPFLLIISTHEPHTPVAAPDSLQLIYRDSVLLPVIRSLNYGGIDREVPDTLGAAANYYATVQQLDHAFGQFMGALDGMGLDKETLVFFTSDNGPEHPVNLEESQGAWDDPIRDMCAGTPGPFRGMKRYPYEGGHRVPGIVRWTGKIPAGSVSDELFNGSDILPTFCSLAGVELPADRTIDGENGWNLLAGRPFERVEPVLWIYPTHGDTWFRMPQISMRSGPYSLIGWFPPRPAEQQILDWTWTSVPERFELYNILNDPAQKNDLSGDQPEMTASLAAIMIEKWIGIRNDHQAQVTSNQ